MKYRDRLTVQWPSQASCYCRHFYCRNKCQTTKQPCLIVNFMRSHPSWHRAPPFPMRFLSLLLTLSNIKNNMCNLLHLLSQHNYVICTIQPLETTVLSDCTYLILIKYFILILFQHNFVVPEILFYIKKALTKENCLQLRLTVLAITSQGERKCLDTRFKEIQ